jgi:uncharacterized protein
VSRVLVGPVQPQERIQLLDILRGFALLGILQVNWEQTTGWLSDLIRFLATGSFYTMFSLLFGLGVALQVFRAEQAGRPFVTRYLWRMSLLFLIGAVHSIFIWPGDILRWYALLGPVLIFGRRLRSAVILLLAAGVLVFTMAPDIPPKGHLTRRVDPERVEAIRVSDSLASATSYAHPPAWCEAVPEVLPGYRGQVCVQASGMRLWVRDAFTDLSWWQGRDSSILAMFLVGLYVGRRRLFSNAFGRTRQLRWIASVSLVVGLTFSALHVYGGFFDDRGVSLPESVSRWVSSDYIGNIGLAVCYLSCLTLLVTHWPAAARTLAPLGDVGRMALSNYLAQSIVFSLILGPLGFDVMSQVRGGYSLLPINAFFVLQIFFSSWWLRHFRFGPAEWAWRSLTWLQLQPMRLAAKPAVAVPNAS